MWRFILISSVFVLIRRFRLVTKGLVAFISFQITSDSSLRLGSHHPPGAHPSTPSPPIPSSPLAPVSGVSPQATQALAHLESLRSNREYSAYRHHVDVTISLVTDLSLSFRDSLNVLARLVSPLFPEVHYLGVVRFDSSALSQYTNRVICPTDIL